LGLFLDSASEADAQQAQSLGFIQGITTNPKLMLKNPRPALETLAVLIDIFDKHVFYQLTAQTTEAMLDEAWQAYDIRPDRVVIKIPATTQNMSLISKLPGVDIAITSVYSAAQAYLAVQAKAHYVIPYVNRATHLMGNGLQLVENIARVTKGTETQILAASIKSVDEAVNTLHAGADHITVPLELIQAMGDHDLSKQAIQDFANL